MGTKKTQALTVRLDFSPETVELIKRTIATDATDDELKLFLYQAKRTGLDPLARQIYFVKRAGRVVIQTSIDGFRVVAERHGDYAGQDEPEFIEQQGFKHPTISKVRVYKFNGDQRYLAATGVAYWDEYVPPQGQDFMWQKMPHTMLAKVAEALALRKAFPQDLSGIYTDEEMAQADVAPNATVIEKPRQLTGLATEPQRKAIFAIATSLGKDPDEVKEVIKEHFKLENFNDLTKDQASKAIESLKKKEELHKRDGQVVEEVDMDKIDAEIRTQEQEPEWIAGQQN